MAEVDVVAIPSKANYVAFDALRLGRSTQQVVGRLLRFWDARNIKKDGQFMGIVLLLLDEKCSVIHAFIPAALASHFRQVLREGIIFNVSGFEVGRCTKLYKITDHPFLLRFLPATTIIEVSDVGPTIEREKFMLRNFDNLQALANTNIELPGQITFVQGSNLNDPTSTQRLVLRYRIDSSVIVYLSLWDDVAATFRAHLSSGDTIYSVTFISTPHPQQGFFLQQHSTNPRVYQKVRMGIKSGESIARADTAAGIRRKEMVSIHQLHKFISKTDEQDADFLCNAKVLDVLQKNGWSYVSSAVTGVVRYRVELAVHDGHDQTTFVVFDNEMTKFTTKTAATLILEDIEITKQGPTFSLEVEGTTSSNIVQDDQDTLDKDLERVTTSNVGKVENSRKRGRE
ncbi:unnamed protein product [Arabidopsis thaliana]|uniref:(thale cress) hypothetical protein n=1 Tax=Arabidopsis thaliana TaxID=3702 RepID=A0A7G2F195_ARATH|nr:unnamed protein product [Arabidopsis thaliana]